MTAGDRLSISSFFAQCSAVYSYAPNLAAMAAAGLAVDVAYLNLERFRYRSKIRDFARKELDRLKPKDGGALPANLRGMNIYQQVERLAALQNHDHADHAHARGAPQARTRLPDGFWPKWYTYIFEFHQDRTASMVFTGITLIALIVGTAHAVNLWAGFDCFFGAGWIGLSFYLLLLSLLLPILFVWSGGKMVRWACDFARMQVADIERAMQQEVRAEAARQAQG